MRHFLNISDFTSVELLHFVAEAERMKSEVKSGSLSTDLLNKTLAMVFQKPSTRTRLSFEVGMHQLGGKAIHIQDNETGLGAREAVKDVARVMSRYVDGVMLRVNSHSELEEFARYSQVPVINGLSDVSHPCQALADILTIKEHKGQLQDVSVAYVGDLNNVAVSLIVAAEKLGMQMIVSGPRDYQPSREAFPDVHFIEDPKQAVKTADVIYSDVWVSMGQEEEKQSRLDAFAPYCITLDLLEMAKREAIFMHCLPAHRGEEVVDEVVESDQSVVFDQAENRLHAQKAVLAALLA
jgi:ornithine carbamoyltransferase